MTALDLIRNSFQYKDNMLFIQVDRNFHENNFKIKEMPSNGKRKLTMDLKVDNDEWNNGDYNRCRFWFEMQGFEFIHYAEGKVSMTRYSDQ